MKKYVLIVFLAVFSNLVFAQVETDAPTMTKKEKRKAKTEQQYKKTKKLLENKNFVLESDFLRSRRGVSYPVSSNLNFVKVDSSIAIIQIGSPWGYGPNGVGGVTAKGKITKWVLKEDKKRNAFYLSMNVMTPIGIYDVNMTIGPSGGTLARLTGLRSGQLTFDGDLVTVENSRVYEGRSL
ncbi:DUF4251 domain-containing protein [Maribellus comscasis]|uniref:DUF4251 domain-containing protein n=1 Tax=Maribellus comscasis TaxID=2681766 RepID=A0A6I6JWF6_9BACT|nr:DUF4251 domain-containing protein [Maribellus comscasis]QGY47466.1 DUF4251 domain-containing protein [Maribellus comscasis]